jgi:hypothetical protein
MVVWAAMGDLRQFFDQDAFLRCLVPVPVLTYIFLCAKRFVFLQTSKPIFAPGHPKDKCHGQNYFSIRIHMPIIGISTTEFMTIPHYSHVLIVADMSQNYTPVTYGPDSATLYQVCIPSGNLT